MTIGIALATYNGARFLREQLDSITRQTRLPDHMVIRDDGSTDETLEIARQFARAANFEVTLLSDGKRLGPMENFLAAAEACGAEMIAFCDQDDIWEPSKLAICERALVSSGGLLAIHSIGHFQETPTGQLNRLSSTRFPNGTIDGLEMAPHVIVHGMSMMVRKELLTIGLPLKALWEPRFNRITESRLVSIQHHWSHCHDLFALTTARILGSITLVRDCLAHQRLHDKNTSRMVSGWSQKPEILASASEKREAAYLQMSMFCSDFAELMALDACVGVIPAQRCRRTGESYARWSRVWNGRARLLAQETPLSARLSQLVEMTADGAYRGKFKGGLGWRSFAKDAAIALGVPRGNSQHRREFPGRRLFK